MKRQKRPGPRGRIEADSELRDHELVPFDEDWQTYIARKLRLLCQTHGSMKATPITKMVWAVRHEINFNRYFYVYEQPRPVSEIEADLKLLNPKSDP